MKMSPQKMESAHNYDQNGKPNLVEQGTLLSVFLITD